MLERIYGRIGHLGRKGEFEKCQRSNQKIQEGISVRHERCGKTRTQRRNILKGRISGKIYDKEIIRVVRQVI